jgi:hypothetical protein
MNQCPFSVEHREIPEAPLMSLGYARSISFPRLLIEHEQIHPRNIWNYRKGYMKVLENNMWSTVTQPIIKFNLNVDGLWLSDVIAALGDAPDVRTLHFSTSHPYLDFHHTVRQKYSGKPLAVEMQCLCWSSKPIKAGNKLEKLELDICRHDDYKNAEELLDAECLQKIRLDIVAAMGDDVSEMMTTTVRSGGMRLIDRKLVFTKKTKG